MKTHLFWRIYRGGHDDGEGASLDFSPSVIHLPQSLPAIWSVLKLGAQALKLGHSTPSRAGTTLGHKFTLRVEQEDLPSSS